VVLGVEVGRIDFGHVGEEGEEVRGETVGEESLAVLENFAVALVAGFVLVDFHPPEDGGGVVKDLEVEGVLGSGLGEVGHFLERWSIAAVEGEGVEFLVGEAPGGMKFFEPVVVGLWFYKFGLGRGGVEALAEVGEAEDVFELLWGGRSIGVVEVAGRAGGGGGDVEVGLVADGDLDGVEGGAEARAAQPAAEDGGGRPGVGGGAAGVGAGGSEKKSLRPGGAMDDGHNVFPFLEL